MKIKEIPVLDRPRERLLQVGSSNLSNEELLAIIIKTGTKNKSSKEIANDLLKTVNNINELKNINYNSLLKIEGIGSVKAIDILASIELGRRINKTVQSLNNLKFTNPNIIYEYYKDTLGFIKQEKFICIYLDTSKKIIKEKLLFVGTINYSMVQPREIFKEAYLCDASNLIFIHNHPSGNVLPSRDDINLTKKLTELAHLFTIGIVDHIIITKNGYYSFYENGDL